jgi:hypothetical protein
MKAYQQDDVYLLLPCRARNCFAAIGEPCRDGKRKRKNVHRYRVYDRYRNELERRRKFRERYLAEWLRLYGDIFSEKRNSE